MVKIPAANAGDIREHGLDTWIRKIPWRREWEPTPVFLPGESHGERSLAGYGPWSRKEADTTERLTGFSFTFKAKFKVGVGERSPKINV